MDNHPTKMTEKARKQPQVTLETVTLPTVLKHFNAPKVIDFLSLDVEGAEILVMKGMNSFWNQYTFLTILIERPVDELHMLLVKHGYWFNGIYNNWGDALYIHPTTPGFDERMKNGHNITTSFLGRPNLFLLRNASSLHSDQ